MFRRNLGSQLVPFYCSSWPQGELLSHVMHKAGRGSGNGQKACLLVAIRPLLLGGRACLRCSVASVLLALSLLVAGVL